MVITKVTAEFQSSSVFGVESNNVCLTISKPPPKNSVLGRRNVSFGRWHEKRTHVVASALGVPENDARRDNREQTQDEQQAPKRHKADNSAPYTLVDCGGAGNCGWNSVAVGLGIKKGLTYEEACKDIETTVRTLRADVCSHVMRHSTDYKPSWAPDSGETEVTAAGAVPATFEEWAASLLRDRQWMCGMALEAAARRCGVKIVILEETNGEMLEPLVCGTGKKREDPIILYLKDEHFQLVLRQEDQSTGERETKRGQHYGSFNRPKCYRKRFSVWHSCDLRPERVKLWRGFQKCRQTAMREDFATQMWVARQLGWNVIFIQSFGSNNGGLAVAVREEWHNCLQQDSEAIWTQWTQDFESFLVSTQQVIPAKRFPLIGKGNYDVASGEHVKLPFFPAKVIHNVWKAIFGCDTDADADPQHFCRMYKDDLPEETQAQTLPKLNKWQVRNMAATMANKATGPDGISAQHLLTLPDDGWERITQMLNRFETLQTFPSAVQHWKVVFIPKGNAPEGVSADQMRPISVASILYRLWARCRIKQCNEVVEKHLAPLQATTQLDPEVIHLVLRGECPASSFQYGLALDYKKAFDSVNTELGLHLLKRVGLPQNVLGLLSSQWRNQTRWLSFAGAIHAEPLTKVPSLPQGDPFSPLTLALILSCPAKRCIRLFPMVKCALYLDDRTLTSGNVEKLVEAAADWDRLSQVTRLSTNHQKSQLWGRTAAAAKYLREQHFEFPVKNEVEVLGYYLGANPEQHPKRLARVENGKTVARKIATVPIPQTLKSQLAMSLLTSTAAWGQDVTKTQLLRAAQDQHLQNFKLAVFGIKNPSSSDSQSKAQNRSSPHLRQILDLGHGSDLIFVVVTKYMSALARWYKYRVPDSSLTRSFQRNSADVWRAVRKHLNTWGWQEQDWGHWAVPREVHFQITMPKEQRAVWSYSGHYPHWRWRWRVALALALAPAAAADAAADCRHLEQMLLRADADLRRPSE
ncbi:unnamed protein product [Cladocopium goreaui]|uniref:LINE-1 retrotransposable element ORF2 protein (ORF2p) (Long interspersed element-1) (L1) (Retrovirus-related Pol polyprotein LINE-1) n=1 Tax=Cladocopium goreaui TaxID=2562237 RepID=A0A9P1DR82_9DINO|nr:unnamed protein product [Cladocopium goreaui]